MGLDPMMFWNIILSLVVLPFGWAFSKMFQEVKRLQILLNQTREEYVKRNEMRVEMQEILTHLQRLEDKLDRFIENNRG